MKTGSTHSIQRGAENSADVGLRRPEPVAADVVRLYRDERLWSALAEAGFCHVETHYSREVVRRALANMLDEVIDDAEVARPDETRIVSRSTGLLTNDPS